MQASPNPYTHYLSVVPRPSLIRDPAMPSHLRRSQPQPLRDRDETLVRGKQRGQPLKRTLSWHLPGAVCNAYFFISIHFVRIKNYVMDMQCE